MIRSLPTVLTAIHAAMVALRARTPGTPPGDIDDDDENNTFQLPDGRPVRRQLKRWFGRQLQTILGSVPDIGAPLPAAFPSLADYDDPMASAMTPLISGYWDEGGKVTRARLGLDPLDWRVHDPHLHDTIKNASLDFCKETNETTAKNLGDALDELRKELITGLVTQGDSIPELTKRVMGVFENCEKFRAERIARTEASRAVHAASLESAKESGVCEGKKLLISGNSCPLCHEVAAAWPKGLPLDGTFATVGKNPEYSTVRMPPIHPYCRCSTTYVLTEEYEQLLAEYGPPHFETFQEGSLGPEPKPDRKVKRPEKPAKPPKPKKEPKPPEPPKPVKPKPVVVPTATPAVVEAGQFQTHAHVEDWAKRTFPHATHTLGDIPVESWNVIAKELDVHVAKYPDIGLHVKDFGSTGPNVYGSIAFVVRSGEEMRFNPRFWTDLRALRKEFYESVDKGFIPAGVKPAGVSYYVAHESGHLVAPHLLRTDPERALKLYGVFRQNDAFDPTIAATVSSYAKTNAQEAFAESYAAARFQSPEWAGSAQKAFTKALSE